MKVETDYTVEFMAYLKYLKTGWVIIKHADRFTKGIPDMTISNDRNKTVWLESKRTNNVRFVKSWVHKKDELQLITTARLGGYYLVFDPTHSEWAFIDAKLAYKHYREDTTIPETEFILESDRDVLYRKVVEYLYKELV